MKFWLAGLAIVVVVMALTGIYALLGAAVGALVIPRNPSRLPPRRVPHRWRNL